jgi:prevent-host-death family protein
MKHEKLTVWPVQDAKARFSEMLDRCVKDGPQVVTKRGEATAVLVPIGEWRRLKGGAPPMSIREFMEYSRGRGEIPLPPRGQLRLRRAPVFED